MKRILFWKIYLGFGVTFLFIVDGLWLLFNVVHPLPSDTTKALAKISLGAADAAIHRAGLPEFRAQMAAWPADDRGRVLVRPWTKDSTLEDNINSGAVSIQSKDPQGKTYQITYQVTRHLGYGRGPFDIPPEIILLAMLGGLIFSAILAWHLTDPIRRISNGFNQLANSDFGARLGSGVTRRKDELADLTREFDKFAERLQELVATRDRLLSDVSHELRTPLTRLQLAIGLARQNPDKIEESLVRIGAEAQYLDEIVDELLTLSKLEGSPQTDWEYFDLAEVLQAVVEDARFEAAPKNVDVICRVHPKPDGKEWIVAGSGKLIHRAVENILRNAVRFSHRGQPVEVDLASRDGSEFNLRVQDSGPGVAQEFLPSFFDPFAKRSFGDEQGVGLGLSIANRAIVANHGEISAANRPTGGLMISILLRAAAARPLCAPLDA